MHMSVVDAVSALDGLRASLYREFGVMFKRFYDPSYSFECRCAVVISYR